MTDTPFDADRYVDSAAAAVGLPLAPEHRAGVVLNFQRLAEMARLVMEFPLSDDIESAPVFRA